MSKEAISKYYLSDLVNPNNRSDEYVSEVREKIDNLRHILLETFDWTDKGYILFLPNPYYAKKMLLNSLMSQEHLRDMTVFSNCEARDGFMLGVLEKLPITYVYGLRELRKHEKEAYIYMVSLFAEKKPVLFDWRKDPNKFLLLEVIKDTNPVFLADAFIFTPVPGVTVFGYRKELKLDPILLGSSSVSFADKNGFNLSGDFHKFESGTLNVPLLMYLEDLYRNKIKRHKKHYVE